MSRVISADEKNAAPPDATPRPVLSGAARLIVAILNDLLRATLDDVDQVIADVLQRIGLQYGFDRTYVFRLSRDGVYIDNTDEWVADGITPDRDLFQFNQVSAAPIWNQLLASKGALRFDNVANLKADDGARRVLDAGSTRTALVVPILSGGQIAGILGFDSVKALRAITEDEIFLFEAVASGIAALFQRIEAERVAAAARARLELSNNRLKATLTAIPDVMLEVDGQGRLVTWNNADGATAVLLTKAVPGTTLDAVLPPAAAAMAWVAMREADLAGRSQPQRYQHDLPAGPAWIEMTVVLREPSPEECAHRYVLTLRDVTEPTLVLEQLRFREKILGSLFQLSPVGKLLVDQKTGSIVDVNDAFLAAAGYRKSDLLQRNHADLLPPEGRQILGNGARQVNRAGRFDPTEEVYIGADGNPFSVMTRGFELEDPAGRRLVWWVIENTTEIRAQQAAVEAQALQVQAAQVQLQTALEALHDGFALFDADDRLVLCNRRYRDLFPGVLALPDEKPRYEDILDYGLAQGLYRHDGGNQAEFRARLLALHRSMGHETDIEFSDGRIIWAVEQATPDDGRVGLRVDVTAQRRSQQHLSNVIEGAQVGTWEWDVSTRINRINDRWAEMLGYTRADLDPGIAGDWWSAVHPADRGKAEATLERVLSREIEQFEYIVRLRHAAGHWVWVESRGKVVRWRPDGSPGVMAGVHLDVSALKRAEERLENIIDGTQVGTWTYDTRLAMTDINPRWAEMLGYTAAELTPLTIEKWEGLVHPDDMASLVAAETDHFARGEWLVEHELRIRHKAGHWVWILTRGRVIEWDAAGVPTITAGVNLDITPRKELEFALQRERDFLSRLMETSASGIVALSETGQIIFANKEAENVLGRPLSQINGSFHDAADWQISDLDGQPIASEDLPFAQVSSRRQTLRDYRVSVATADGVRRLLSVNAAPLSAPGVAATVVCSVTDITAAVEAEATLRAAMERAEAGSRAKSEFLANMSHEIRTPLNGVLGMAEVLGETLQEPAQRKMLATIQQSGELLLSVINDILDLAKIESGKLSLQHLPFSPAEIAGRVETMHGLKARGKGIELSLLTDSGAALPRLGDAQRVLQILHNLVGNAVKFTETGEVRLVMTGRVDRPLVIEVSDTGIGMTAQQISRVFDPFTQADGTITRRFGGTGLGLPIVRELVTVMGGTISVSAEAGKGTHVRVSLPLAMADPAAGMPSAAPVVAAPASVMQVRALVAEDNATNRFILRSMLANLGVSFTMVNDGDEAVATWQPGLFDVLLLDISMPHKDGLAALDEINAKALRLGAKVPPALAVTANAMTHHVAQYSAAGFAACVAKPVRMDQLAASIAEACRAA